MRDNEINASVACLAEGTLLQGGRYRITRLIGMGGFGCTYEAIQTGLDERVAVKEFFVRDFCNRDGATARVTVGTEGKRALVDKLRGKFVAEARALSRMRHPGIVRVRDVFSENGTPPEAAVISSGTPPQPRPKRKSHGVRNMALVAGVAIMIALLAYGILSISGGQPAAPSASEQPAVSSVSEPLAVPSASSKQSTAPSASSKQSTAPSVSEQSAAPGKTGRAGAAAINGHEYVDLGLSVRWATCNIGADSPEEYGNYYAWGETKTKSSYDKDNCETYGKNIDDIGGTSRDVAHVRWGSPWRMPTLEEFEELLKKCDWKWTTLDGVSGYRVTGKNGKSIFLPAAGWRDGTSLDYAGEFGLYWSSTPYGSDTQHAYGLDFYSGDHDWNWDYRRHGLSVRPVSEF